MSQIEHNKQVVKTKLITPTQLKERGWTDSVIRDLLGPHDVTRINPYYRSGPPMRLYDTRRVEAAEASAAWASRAETIRKRKEAAARAVETKRAQLLRHLDAVKIIVPICDHAEITQLACDDYNQRLYDRGDYESWQATSDSDIAFLERIIVNYLRHALSDYDAELADIFGRVGVQDGYREINRKAYAAIAMAYPTLADECQRQLERKFGGQG